MTVLPRKEKLFLLARGFVGLPKSITNRSQELASNTENRADPYLQTKHTLQTLDFYAAILPHTNEELIEEPQYFAFLFLCDRNNLFVKINAES